MALREKNAGKFSKNKFEYVNLEFTDVERDHILQWIADRNTDLEDGLVTMADQGFKVSVGLNAWSGMYNVALTCKDDNRAIFNKCVGYEHVDLGKLIQIMLYVCTEMLTDSDAVIAPAKSINDW